MSSLRRTIAVFTASLCATIAGCAISSPQAPEPEQATSPLSSQATTTRQTDEAGRPLPFETEFTERWSNLNDGSAYEPCTALDANDAAGLGLDPDSVRDVALANYQTARGCGWHFADANTSTLSQGVGNELPLPQYKKKYAVNINWLYDTAINGRTVAVGEPKGLQSHSCLTAVQSGSAIVTTSVIISVNPPPTPEICSKAIAFTRATIDKMPP
ncbi:DUF3558 family protein [Gordonia sp. VNK1]|uniref:DUF3558 family protein n=1 Tax=Gordonia oleivorans TaxID=3156618 RepID=UPI0032B32E28